MHFLFSFDQDTKVEKTLMQTLACQLSLTFMQLLFSFDWDTRVEKTLMQTLSSQLSSILVATFSLANFHSSYCSFPFEGNITSQIWPGCPSSFTNDSDTPMPRLSTKKTFPTLDILPAIHDTTQNSLNLEIFGLPGGNLSSTI